MFYIYAKPLLYKLIDIFMAQKVAEQVVDMLVDTGVKRIYAVTGDSLNEINDAVRRNEKIDWIHVRHEETGAFAACIPRRPPQHPASRPKHWTCAS